MKAIRVHEFGEPREVLRKEELPTPKPGSREVLVRIRAVSLNSRDIRVVKGLSKPNLPLPFVPLSDGAGEVVEVGAGVTRVKLGDRVAGNVMQFWLAGRPIKYSQPQFSLGYGIEGMLAEYVVLPEDGLVHLPEHLSYEQAATLPVAAVTAWNGLTTEGGLKPGDTVLIQGTGGVSLFALQFACLAGARTIITSSSDEKLERARQLGASDSINYKAMPNWDERAIELTGGEGVDHVVEVGGADTLTKSLHALKVGGRISLIGILSGSGGEVDLLPIVRKNVRVQGMYVGSREMFEEMNCAIALHKLQPVVDRVFPFEEACEAFKYMESGAHFGKICICL